LKRAGLQTGQESLKVYAAAAAGFAISVEEAVIFI
jgi:hypothetical protein